MQKKWLHITKTYNNSMSNTSTLLPTYGTVTKVEHMIEKLGEGECRQKKVCDSAQVSTK